MTERHQNLLAAYFANQLTQDEKAELIQLLDSDKELENSFREMQQAYIAACVPAFEKTKEEDFQALQYRIQPRRYFWRSFAFAAAVAALACLGIALYSINKYNESERFIADASVTTISASRGAGTQTVLPDGTRVCLNAASSLSFDRGFGRSAREITLDGEGFFEVTGDARRPFRVYAGGTCVTVKGTVFNVRCYADEPDITVSLLEGSVELSAPTGKATLRPGLSAVVSRSDGSIRLEANDHSVADWTKGKIVFSDKTIPEILGYVERCSGVRFEYDADMFEGERFTGNIPAGLSIDEILRYLDVDHKFAWQRKDDTVRIYKK